jgi:rare lipoprotein A (peptidoglycan hydrolase)
MQHFFTSGYLRRRPSQCLRVRRFSTLGVLLGVALLSQSCGMIASSSRGTVPEMVSIPQPSIAKPGPTKQPTELKGTVSVQIGQASWYGKAFAGKPTTSGEIFNHELLTAAHRSFPLGTKVRVTNVANGKSVEVKVNDRGPYVGGRIIDLSSAAARALGMIEDGLTEVRLEAISFPGESQIAKDD